MAAPNPASAPIVQAAAGTNTFINGQPGMRWRCLGIWGSISANGTVKFQSHTTNVALTGAMTLSSGQPFSAGPVSIENGEALFPDAPAGESIDVVSTGGAFNGFCIGQWVAAPNG